VTPWCRAVRDHRGTVRVFVTGEILGAVQTGAEAVEAVKAAGPGMVRVDIDSPGGDCLAAMELACCLRSRNARTVITLAGSAASLIAIVGQPCDILESGRFFLHYPLTAKIGNARELREAADRLDDWTPLMVRAYCERTGWCPAVIREVMAAETWLDAREAAHAGFADRVIADSPQDATPATLIDVECQGSQPTPDEALLLDTLGAFGHLKVSNLARCRRELGAWITHSVREA
jgi:ATP-dependent protease ClpP protease subunit